MFRKYCLLILLIILGTLTYHISNSFIKQGNIYSRLIEQEEEQPTIPQGYVEIANRALIEHKKNNASAETLNKFLIGLKQYFSLTLYLKDNVDIIKNAPQLFNVSEPISLPVAKLGDISFYKAEVFGHPLYKHKVDVLYNESSSPYQYLLNATAKSDIITFTGYFDIDRTPYYFVYNLKNTTYQCVVKMVRGYTRPVSGKITLNFHNEDLIHTYDSAYENYTQINNLIRKKFITAVEQIYLSYLGNYIFPKFRITIAKKDVQYLSQYRKSIISALIESGISYINGRGLASFEVKSLNFINSVRDKVFTQTYTNITIYGILDFVKTEIGNSLIELLEDSNEYKISEDVEFIYPLEGEKLAFIEFIVRDGKHLVPKKFKIKSIKVIAVYNARSAKVRRNKEVCFNNSAFLIKFDVKNYDPAYEFLFRHVGNDISRAIERVLVAAAN